jgi:hypothetical protein
VLPVAARRWVLTDNSEFGESQEGAERRDDGEAERRRWTGLPARRSGGVSVRGWKRTGQGALVGCSGAGGARDCGCGAAEVADDDEQRRRQRSGGGAERRRSRGATMRAHERIKEVEECSWMCCGTKKRHGELEQLLVADGTRGGCGRRRRDVAG